VAAADRLFREQGFHATSVDAVAEAAGYTKGAVYSNFAGKEDLFFAAYERRVEQRAAELHQMIESAPSAKAALRGAVASTERRADGWTAVFFEFWAHVLRHPEHRARFAAAHRRALEPFVAGVHRLAAESRRKLPLPVEEMALAQLALSNGLRLERLTRPDEVDAELMERVLLAIGPWT
jgi:AcrR family transcriptional regulator